MLDRTLTTPKNAQLADSRLLLNSLILFPQSDHLHDHEAHVHMHIYMILIESFIMNFELKHENPTLTCIIVSSGVIV